MRTGVVLLDGLARFTSSGTSGCNGGWPKGTFPGQAMLSEAHPWHVWPKTFSETPASDHWWRFPQWARGFQQQALALTGTVGACEPIGTVYRDPPGWSSGSATCTVTIG